MSKLVWDQDSQKVYETGVSNGVLFVKTDGVYGTGVAWNGLINVTEKPTGAEPNPVYADNIKYLNLISKEELEASVEAYTYPKEFEACDGLSEIETGVNVGQQARSEFALVYKSLIGDGSVGTDLGYKINIIYGAMAKPSEKAHGTVNDKPEAMTFSWDLTTTPVTATIGEKQITTANVVIDSTKVDAAKLATIEAALYGTSEGDPRLPFPDEIATILASEVPSALALSSITPTDGENAAPTNTNIVLTFNNQIAKESVVVTSAEGDLVECAKSFNATGKILTINPTEDLTAQTSYIVTIGGVVDIYGQGLSPEVKNFTTA